MIRHTEWTKTAGTCTSLHPGETRVSEVLLKLLHAQANKSHFLESKLNGGGKMNEFLVVDVGANKGEIINNFVQSFATIDDAELNILGLEPESTTYAHLTARNQEEWEPITKKSRINIVLEHAGAAETPGLLTTYAPKDCVQSYNPTVFKAGCEQVTFNEEFARKSKYIKSGAVSVTTLDAVLKKHYESSFIDILYMDAQFLEFRILYGALDNFNDDRIGIVVFEYVSNVHGTHYAVTWLGAFGYRIFVLYNDDLVEITPRFGLYKALTKVEEKLTKCHVMIAIKDQQNVNFVLSAYNKKMPILEERPTVLTLKNPFALE